MQKTLPKASRVVLALDQVTSLRETQVIRAVRSDGQSTAAGVLVGAGNDERIISDANALAARLGIIPAGHWRRTGAYGCPEFYSAGVVTGLTWLRFLIALGIDPEDESAIQVMFDV
jgi:hypothetical protein